MDHLDCRFYLMLLSFLAPLSELEKNMEAEKNMHQRKWIQDIEEIKSERILNIIKQNTCDSEEHNKVSNMPTNYLTHRSIFFLIFSNSISKSVSHSYSGIQKISESEEQVVEISQINNEIYIKKIIKSNIN